MVFEYLFGIAISCMLTASLTLWMQRKRSEKNLTYLRNRLDAQIETLQSSNAGKADEIEHLTFRIRELEHINEGMRDEIEHRGALCADRQIALDCVLQSIGQWKRHAEKLALEVSRLRGMATAFERWHEEMTSLMVQNKAMHLKNEELSSIVKHVVIVSFNASIEAARAGTSGCGFAVVAGEVRQLALRSEQLSKNYSESLYKSDLTTTATFQDIQAGGKMMLASLASIEALAKQFQSQLELVP